MGGHVSLAEDKITIGETAPIENLVEPLTMPRAADAASTTLLQVTEGAPDGALARKVFSHTWEETTLAKMDEMDPMFDFKKVTKELDDTEEKNDWVLPAFVYSKKPPPVPSLKRTNLPPKMSVPGGSSSDDEDDDDDDDEGGNDGDDAARDKERDVDKQNPVVASNIKAWLE